MQMSTKFSYERSSHPNLEAFSHVIGFPDDYRDTSWFNVDSRTAAIRWLTGTDFKPESGISTVTVPPSRRQIVDSRLRAFTPSAPLVGIEENPGPKSKSKTKTKTMVNAIRKIAKQQPMSNKSKPGSVNIHEVQAPVSFGMTVQPFHRFSGGSVKGSTTRGSLIITGIQPGVYSVVSDGSGGAAFNYSGNVTYLNVHPGLIFGSSGIGQVCTQFLRFRFRRLRMTFVTSVATSSTGSIAIAYVNDVQNSSINYGTLTTSYDGVCITPVWNPACSVNLIEIDKDNWYYLDLTNPAGQGIDRMLYQGAFRVASAGQTYALNDVLGRLMFEYEIELMDIGSHSGYTAVSPPPPPPPRLIRSDDERYYRSETSTPFVVTPHPSPDPNSSGSGNGGSISTNVLMRLSEQRNGNR